MTGLIYLFSLFLAAGSIALDGAVSLVSITALSIGLGGILAWQAGRSFFGYPTASFASPAIGWFLLFYILVLIIGQLILSFNILPTLIFPPFHILAATIPPLAILAYAARALKPVGLQWREIILQLSSGAFVATAIAFLTEIIMGLLVLLIALVITALTPEGQAFLETLTTNIQDPIWTANPKNIEELLLSPPIISTAAIVLILLAPAFEELIKPLGLLLMNYRRPEQAQIFVWGLAAGAGFALAENLFNTILALDTWVHIMLLRLGGTAMHCLGAGLIALGWHNLRTTRRPWRLFGAYILSVTIHAMWNGVAIGITGISALFDTDLTIIMSAILATITLFLIGGIIFLTKRSQVSLKKLETNAPLPVIAQS